MKALVEATRAVHAEREQLRRRVDRLEHVVVRELRRRGGRRRRRGGKRPAPLR